MALGGINVNDECPVCGPGFVVRIIDRLHDFIACEKLTPGVYRYYRHDSSEVARAVYKAQIKAIQDMAATPHIFINPNDDRFPHKCPTCGGAAYIGLNVVEHQGASCK